MKIKALLITITVLLLTACQTTSRADRYKTLKEDAIILCGGTLDEIYYSDTKYATKIKCNGKTFNFAKEQKTGIFKLLP